MRSISSSYDLLTGRYSTLAEVTKRKAKDERRKGTPDRPPLPISPEANKPAERPSVKLHAQATRLAQAVFPHLQHAYRLSHAPWKVVAVFLGVEVSMVRHFAYGVGRASDDDCNTFMKAVWDRLHQCWPHLEAGDTMPIPEWAMSGNPRVAPNLEIAPRPWPIGPVEAERRAKQQAERAAAKDRLAHAIDVRQIVREAREDWQASPEPDTSLRAVEPRPAWRVGGKWVRHYPPPSPTP